MKNLKLAQVQFSALIAIMLFAGLTAKADCRYYNGHAEKWVSTEDMMPRGRGTSASQEESNVRSQASANALSACNTETGNASDGYDTRTRRHSGGCTITSLKSSQDKQSGSIFVSADAIAKEPYCLDDNAPNRRRRPIMEGGEPQPVDQGNGTITGDGDGRGRPIGNGGGVPMSPTGGSPRVGGEQSGPVGGVPHGGG